MTDHRIVYCHCAYAKVVPQDVKRQVLQGLCASDAAFDAVADLCEMSAKRDPALHEIAQREDLQIVACYPRAVRWLFAAADAQLPSSGVEIQNMRTQTAEEVLLATLSSEGCRAVREEQS